jgi:hypothetical protein
MTTKLFIQNKTSSDVLTYITLGATPGCVQDVSTIIVDKVTINKLYPLMGNFMLPANTKIELSAPGNEGFNGNVSFNTPPLNCPTPQLPDGVNLAEFIINNGFQEYGQETVDNSCVAGANAFIEFELSADDWSANGGAISVKHIKNGVKLDNTNRVGVYPYGCDNCTASVQPPSCVGLQPQYANAEPICNVQRPASGNNGGSVTISFHGFTPGSD